MRRSSGSARRTSRSPTHRTSRKRSCRSQRTSSRRSAKPPDTKEEKTAEIAEGAKISLKNLLSGLCVLCSFFFVVAIVHALGAEVLRSTGAVPAYVAGQFREPAGFQQSSSGQYFVFDRRGHTVYGL